MDKPVIISPVFARYASCMRNAGLNKKKLTHLSDSCDHCWEHDEWKAKDVEQRQRHECGLRVQDIPAVNHQVDPERDEGYLVNKTS